MPADKKEPTLEPTGLTNKDGNYCLQHDDMYGLVKYMWTGVLLATTVDEYKKRIPLDDDVAKKLKGVLDPLVATNKTTQEHCKNFKDNVYPSIVKLADDVYNYADNAGGDPDTSYYANILDLIKKMGKEPAKKDEYQDDLDQLVKVQVDAIGGMIKKADEAVKNLRRFEEDTKKDQVELQSRSKAVKDELKKDLGDVASIEESLSKNRKELDKDNKDYEHDKVVACTTLTYFWCGPIGLIAAVTVASVYGSKAAKLAAAIKEIKNTIASEEKNLRDEKRVVADLNTVDTGLDGLLKCIGPAIKAIEEMMGFWSAISADMTAIQTMVRDHFPKAQGYIATLDTKKILKKWDTLKTSVDKYRKAAFVTDTEKKTLDDLQKQFEEQSKKSGPGK